MAVTFPRGIVRSTLSSVGVGECRSYLNVTLRISRPPSPSVMAPYSFLSVSPSGGVCSSVPQCIWFMRSSDIFTSCIEYRNPISCDTGLLSCPTINCIASMAPRVMPPFITAIAASTVISMFFTSLINTLPASCSCCSFSDFICIPKSSLCLSSHSFLRRSLHPCSFISCMHVTNW